MTFFVVIGQLTTLCVYGDDSITATLLEEVLSLKGQISALELEIYDLKNTDSCSCDSSSGSNINVGNKTATIKYVVFNGDTCSGVCTIYDSYDVDYVAYTSEGHYTIVWENDFSSDYYSVSCNSNPDNYS